MGLKVTDGVGYTADYHVETKASGEKPCGGLLDGGPLYIVYLTVFDGRNNKNQELQLVRFLNGGGDNLQGKETTP